MKVIVEPFDRNKYRARVEGKPAVMGAGHSPESAIGDMIKTHSEEFAIELTIQWRDA